MEMLSQMKKRWPDITNCQNRPVGIKQSKQVTEQSAKKEVKTFGFFFLEKNAAGIL